MKRILNKLPKTLKETSKTLKEILNPIENFLNPTQKLNKTQRKLIHKTKGNKRKRKMRQRTKGNLREIKRVDFKGAMGNKRRVLWEGWELRGFMREAKGEIMEGESRGSVGSVGSKQRELMGEITKRKQRGSVRGKQEVKMVSRSNKQKIMH